MSDAEKIIERFTDDGTACKIIAALKAKGLVIRPMEPTSGDTIRAARALYYHDLDKKKEFRKSDYNDWFDQLSHDERINLKSKARVTYIAMIGAGK